MLGISNELLEFESGALYIGNVDGGKEGILEKTVKPFAAQFERHNAIVVYNWRIEGSYAIVEVYVFKKTVPKFGL